MKYFKEGALLWLADTVIGEVGAHYIFYGAIITVLGWHAYGRGGAHNIYHGAINTVVGYHVYGRGRST